jgi:TPR repeat protein
MLTSYLFITGCAHKDQLELASGKYYFEKGYYKHAMSDLLPVAVDGDKDAQYAVGYMYYYGYGVTQDPAVGQFWIERAARNGSKKAAQALVMIDRDNREKKQYVMYTQTHKRKRTYRDYLYK